ncbi:MAG: hypothetical protein V9H69_17955 [Anaerolineae bacterium]
MQRLMERGDYTPTQAELEIEDHDRAARRLRSGATTTWTPPTRHTITC